MHLPARAVFEDMRQHFLGGALANRAGHAEPAAAGELAAVRGGEGQVSRARVGSQNDARVLRQVLSGFGAVQQNGGGALREGLARKTVPIEAFAAQGHE